MIRPSSPLTMLLSRHTRRREFITLLGGAAAAWPLAARAQQASGCGASACSSIWPHNDPEGRARDEAFAQGLKELGWIEGGNLRIDTVAGQKVTSSALANMRPSWSAPGA